MRSKGKITSWNDDKGYGFIAPLAGGKQVFIHVKSLSNRNRRPEVNDVVTYALSKDKQGRPCATNAALAGDKPRARSTNWSRAPAILFALLFLAAVYVAVYLGRLPVGVIVAYATLSLITFVFYAVDKSSARRGNQRISEKALHLFSLVGGWPGALIAQQTLRHKSKKMSFRIVFWFTVLVNCSVLVLLHTDSGKAALLVIRKVSEKVSDLFRYI